MTSTIVFETPWFAVEAFGDEDPYYRITGPDGVICAALTDDGRFVMVEQFRPAIAMTTLEFPAGAIDEGETPDQAAYREIHEETGFRCASIDLIAPGRMLINRHDHLEYFAIGLGAVSDPDPATLEQEGTRPILVGQDELRQMIARDTFIQSAALAILPIVRIKCGIDLLADSLETIRDGMASWRASAGAW